MISLKAFAPVLASTLGTTPAAIYERQRALVRQGLLPAPVGRGPGNGMPATAETVAMILIALMVTDNLSDTDNRVKRVAAAKVNDEQMPLHLRGCLLTGKRDFRSALIAILKMTEFPSRLRVSVSRNNFCSRIFYVRDDAIPMFSDPIYQKFPIRAKIPSRERVSEFGDWSRTASNLVVEASLRDGVLQTISRALRSENIEILTS
jgi:hypothetical protein